MGEGKAEMFETMYISDGPQFTSNPIILIQRNERNAKHLLTVLFDTAKRRKKKYAIKFYATKATDAAAKMQRLEAVVFIFVLRFLRPLGWWIKTRV